MKKLKTIEQEQIRVHIQRLRIQKLSLQHKLKSKRKSVNYAVIEDAILELEKQINKYNGMLK